MSKEKPKEKSRYFLGETVDLKPLYRPEDVDGVDYQEDIGDPGEFPYVRGPFGGGYPKRPWRTLQYAGYGAGEDTNARWKFLLSQG